MVLVSPKLVSVVCIVVVFVLLATYKDNNVFPDLQSKAELQLQEVPQRPTRLTNPQVVCKPENLIVASDHPTFDLFMDRLFGAFVGSAINEEDRPVRLIAGLIRSGALSYLKDGFAFEFGVFQGETLHRIYLTFNDLIPGPIAGFDSFEGLPDAWADSNKGRFALNSNTTRKLIERFQHTKVQLVKGFFQHSLPGFIVKHSLIFKKQPATLIHFDGDMFISTIIPFTLLTNNIMPGSLLMFDELWGYNTYQEHEILAYYLWAFEREAVLCAVATPMKPNKEFKPDPFGPDWKEYKFNSTPGGKKWPGFFLANALFQVVSLNAPVG